MVSLCLTNAVLAHSAGEESHTGLSTIKNIEEHVRYLSSEALEGRLTGSAGERLATEYVAAFFHDLGLEPAGDNGTFFQEFEFISGVTLGKHNSLHLRDSQNKSKALLLGKDWSPLACSESGTFNMNSSFVVAGYGISAPATGRQQAYDSYKNLNVQNKWVLVFEEFPKTHSIEQQQRLSAYASARYKAFIAKEHGAKGIIFIKGPNSKSKHELIPMNYDTSVSNSGIIALSMKDQVIDALLKTNKHPLNSLRKIQNTLDAGQFPSLPSINTVRLSGQIDIKQIIKKGRNVLAQLRQNPNANKVIIIGAHIDHLGHGNNSNSRAQAFEAQRTHPGADDNASGVASIMDLAKTLSELKEKNKLSGEKNILFAAWSGEELGLLGSTHFLMEEKNKDAASNTIKQSVSIKQNHLILDAAINLDMVGHLKKKLVLQGLGSSTQWAKIIKNVSVNRPFTIITQDDPYLPTDSTAFYLQGIPSINLFTGAHDNYHTPRDTADTLNYKGIKQISDLLVDLILAIEQQPNSMACNSMPNNVKNTEHELKIYLGTIPDYASADISGVKISGVAKNSPAELAGLQKNDILIELAGKKIHDIYDYTYILDALPVGEPVIIKCIRGKKELKLPIIAQVRG